MKSVFFPYVRKGLANSISEEEVFGKVEGNDRLARMRASLSIRAQYKVFKGKKGQQLTQEKEISLYGPADVSSINPQAISLCHPNANSEGFPVSYFPYIEFWEPDFPWRYTPAKVSENGRLRPWIALLTFRADQVTIREPEDHLPYVCFQGDEVAYNEVFFDINELSRSAHAQGPENGAPTISRIIGLRGWKEGMEHQDMVPLLDQTDYIVCLVPTFEVGRLRGLGVGPEALQNIPAQAAAWDSYEVQKSKTRGLEFPVYYSWSFRSGTLSFEGLVRTLTLGQSKKAGVAVDVTHMGEGFDYEIIPHETSRKTIVMPAAAGAPQREEEPAFPARSEDTTESQLYTNLYDIVTGNPVFLENAEDIGAELKDGRQKELSKDDPLVVPPAYGARHAMATSLDKYEWLEKVNMDVHYRAAAGVGRKFVQENQEQLMDRAWKQVEAVQALNRELYQRLLSIGVNTSLHGKVVGPYGKDNKYLASLMFYLGSMKDASSRDGSGKDTSITAALAGKDVAAAFATPTFHRMTDQVAKIVKGLDTKTLMENMLEHHTCAFPDPYCYGAVSIKALKQYSSDALVSIFNTIVKVYATNYFKLAYLPGPSSIETTFSVGFNAEVRYGDRKTQYIGAGPDRGSHEAAWDNIWLFWNDWKWMDDFKKWEQLSKKIDWSKKQIPHSPILWYYLYPGSCKRFFDEGCADHPSYGYSVIGHEDGKAPDLIGYPSERYVELFGEKKPITKFRFYGKYLYIVNEDAVRMIVASQSGGNTSSIEKGESAAVYYYDLPYVGTVKGLYRPILYRYTTSNYGTQDWRHYLGDYTEIKNESFSCEQDEEVSRSYRDRLSKYLSRPSFIEINPNKFQEEIQTFNSEDEYQQFLLGRTDKLTISYITLWKQFNAQVSLLEMYTPQQAGTPAAPAPQPAPTLSDDLPYEEACSIVGDFFSEFFADSATGYKLRSNYIDELLRSKYPILAYPIFPEPTYYYLKKFSEELVIPGAGSLPEDSVTLFESNPAFIEAFLAGMNTEMGREMLWREYPTDQRGSYFRKFWDSESTVESIRKETFFDITTLHTWEKPLGENMLDSKANLLIFALKGRLMRLYPKTRIYLHRAVCTSGKKLAFDPSTDKEGCILQPVMETFINGDTLLVGFNISFQKALGNPGKKEYGYMLTFKEDVEGLDFAVEKEGSDFKEDMDSAVFADTLKNDPSIMGKHISLFLNK